MRLLAKVAHTHNKSIDSQRQFREEEGENGFMALRRRDTRLFLKLVSYFCQ